MEQAATRPFAPSSDDAREAGTGRLGTHSDGSAVGMPATVADFDPNPRQRSKQNATVRDEQIFVAIPCFRDRECGPTIDDLFAKATNPERVSVGVCWQFDEAEDNGLTRLQTAFRRQVRHRHFHFSESQGANWARAQAQDLWHGEDYVLQVDSHMRFMPGWDEKLINALERCPSPRALLSTLPAAYEPPSRFDPELIHFRSLLHVNVLEHPFHLGGVQLAGGLYQRLTHPGLRRTPFCAAGYVFGSAWQFKDVPIDPHYFFWGDELSLAARLWTHGYDIFQPEETLVMHWWTKPTGAEALYKRQHDPRHKRSLERLKHLLGLPNSADTEALREIERYGLGRQRPLAGFFDFAGIDPASGELQAFAHRGDFESSYALGCKVA